MTAEVSVMNKTAVVLAADSAATTRSPKGIKIHTSAEKIFQLTSDHKIGLMIHGSASLMSVPWETIISTYRDELGTKKLDKVKDYAISFVDYIRKNIKKFFPLEEQKEDAQMRIISYFSQIIFKKISTEINLIITKTKKPTNKDYEEIITEIFKEEHDLWTNAKKIKGVTKKDIEKLASEYKGLINASVKQFDKALPIKLSPGNIKKLKDIAICIFVSFPQNIGRGMSGVIFTGFGTKEIFPAICVLKFECIANNILKYELAGDDKIEYNNQSHIQAFAQGDMVHLFMEGVHPDYQKTIQALLENMIDTIPDMIVDNTKKLNKKEKDKLKRTISKAKIKLLKETNRRLTSYRQKNYVVPVLSSVTTLPKDELASLAESLVHLTSLKRRVSIDQEETVGGPIDVALISKTDGFRWIKRKDFYDIKSIV